MYHICKTYYAHSMLQYTHEEGREFSYEKTQSETYAVPVVHYDRHFHTRGHPADNRRRRTGQGKNILCVHCQLRKRQMLPQKQEMQPYEKDKKADESPGQEKRVSCM